MNPDLPKTPQEEMEARLIALLLGELSDQEAAAWCAAIATNPELAKLHDRLKQTISLVREATAKVTEPAAEQAAQLKLSEERREKLLAHFKTVKPREFAPEKPKRKLRLVELAAVVAIIGVLAAISIPTLSNFRREEELAYSTALQVDTLSSGPEAIQRVARESYALREGRPIAPDGSSSVDSLNVVGYVNVVQPGQPASAGAQPQARPLFDSISSPASGPTSSQETPGPTAHFANTARPQIVLPSAGDPDPARASKGTQIAAVNDGALRPWDVSASLRGFYDESKRAGEVSSPASQPVATLEERVPTLYFENTRPVKPDQAAPNVPPPSRIVLPSMGESESLGATEVVKVADGQALGRDNLGLGVRGESEGKKGVTTWAAGENLDSDFSSRYALPQRDKQVNAPAAKPESGFSDYLAEAQRRLADGGTAPGLDARIVDGRVQVSGQLYDFYSDLNRTPPATPPPTAGAVITMNGVDQSTLAGRGISPTTGLPADDFSRDGAALGQSLAVTRADRALTRSYGLEPANRESGARFGAGGGGAGGAGISGAEGLLAQTELRGSRGRGGSAGAGGIPVGPQNAPGQVAAGDVVAGFVVTPTPALQPAKPQESLPDIAAVAELDADKAPVLGKLFRSDSSTLADRGSAPSFNGTTPRQDQPGQQTREILAYDGTVVPPVSTSAGVPVASAPVPRFKSALTETALPSADAGVAWTEESLRRKSSSIVLPSVETAGKTPSDGTVEQLALAREDKVEAATQVQDGRILLEAGRLDDAEVKLKEAVKQDPGNQAAFYYLSLAKERRYAETEAKREQDFKTGIKEVKQTFEKPVQMAQRGTESLKEPEVRTAQKKVDELSEKLAVADLDAAGTAPAPMIESEKVRQLHSQLNYAEALLNREEAEAKSLGQPGSEQRRGALQAQVDKLTEKVEQARTDDLAKAESNRPYYEAKLNLEEQLRLRSALNLKLNAEGFDLSLPKTAMVEILDRAQAPTEKSGFWRSLGAPIGGTYQSAARVRVERDQSDIQGFSDGAQSGAAYDPYFVQTEFEVIQSEAVLAKAVEKLKSNEGWANARGTEKPQKEETIALLKKRLDLKPVPNTSLVEIRAKSDKPDEAAAIANAVADAYEEFRQEKRKHLTSGGIEALKTQYAEQEQKVAQAQRELKRVAKESNVEVADLPIRKPATNAPIPQPEIQTSENAFSTFSLNVSDVSFKLAAASLEQGQTPEQASIRSEEFINAFDYRDPEPLPGVPVAFAWERARYPFGHNRDLLRFSIKTGAVGRQAGRPLNLVLLLDNSGSMERADRVQIIREALHVLAGQLQPQDKISVLTFARTPRLWVDGAPGDKAGEVAEQISSLTPQGGTNFEEGMNAAYATALRHYLAGGINRVVMLTDGAANLGNVEPESLKQKVEAHRKQGIALDCFGIGWEGFNDDLLETLSRNGDGRYGFINSPEEAATEFAGQLAGALQVAASDVKVQVEFNPARVTAYRQIGYAKHQLTKEQFRDNTVDAAEIAAQEAGNALYTAEVNPAGEGPLAIMRVRFKIPGTSDYREHEWAVPYNGSAVSLEQASPAMRLAASASAFSEWLVASPFANEVTPDALLGYLGGVPEIYGADARPKKLEWMIRQAKSIEGK